MQSHYITASRHCITPSHYVTASHHCVITHEAPEAPPTPLGDVTSLYRLPTVLRDTLGQHYSLKVFPNRAARHSRATLQAYIVPQQFCATPSGNTLPLFRRRNVRIDPVMNMLGDTFGTPWATIQAHIATPIEPHCTFGRHYYVPERVVVDDGAAGCNCSHKKANNTCN